MIWLNAVFYVGVAGLGMLMLLMGHRLLAKGLLCKNDCDLPTKFVRAMPGALFTLFGMSLIGTLVWGYGLPYPLPSPNCTCGASSQPVAPAATSPAVEDLARQQAGTSRGVPAEPAVNSVADQQRPATPARNWRAPQPIAMPQPIVPVTNTTTKSPR